MSVDTNELTPDVGQSSDVDDSVENTAMIDYKEFCKKNIAVGSSFKTFEALRDVVEELREHYGVPLATVDSRSAESYNKVVIIYLTSSYNTKYIYMN